MKDKQVKSLKTLQFRNKLPLEFHALDKFLFLYGQNRQSYYCKLSERYFPSK